MTMFFEMSRVYRDIIEEVGRMLESENDVDLSTIQNIKSLWLNNLTDRIERHHEIVQEPTADSTSCSDSEDEVKGKDTQNYMMCLFDKVTKNKYKWKVNFKQGFLNIGNADYAFSLAQGDLDW